MPVVLLVVVMGGCGSPPKDLPQTWPVKGKALNAGQAIPAGIIEFKPSGEGKRATGEIGPDGSFSLFTFFENDKIEGAMPGSYRVTIIPPIPPDQNVQIFNVSKTYTIEPKENEFTIDVSKK